MKRYILIFALSFVAVGLAAQTGLFRIAFGDALNTADSLLANGGYFAREVESTLVKYYPVESGVVEAVTLVVDPVSELVHGWLVLYSASNTKEQDQYTIDRLHQMHGNEVHIDPVTEQVTWVLSPSRTVTAAYVKTGSLSVLYRDSDFANLFSPPHPPAETEQPD